jgi:ubiquinone/menaquinone biosynthesis C-methylase UbiE
MACSVVVPFAWIFGSGVGYFALKLSPVVGKRGSVVAEDIRRESLAFLRIRAFVRSPRNIRTIRGELDDPRLAAGFADAVLIANTYHELTEPKAILRRLAESLKPGGRLASHCRSSSAIWRRGISGIADRTSRTTPGLVETEVSQCRF